MHYNIVIATPGRSMHSQYVESLSKTLAELSKRGVTWTYLSKVASFVPTAREWTATGTDGNDWSAVGIGAGKFTYDKVFWIDSDVSWDVNDFIRLWESELDIVSGVMPVSVAGRIGAMRFGADGAPGVMMWTDILMDVDPVAVDGVSFGFLAVRSGVFEKMERPWFKIRQTVFISSDTGLYMDVDLGEDYSWCVGAAEVGFEIFLDPMVKVRHHKETVYVI
jgi:hypothetical protein